MLGVIAVAMFGFVAHSELPKLVNNPRNIRDLRGFATSAGGADRVIKRLREASRGKVPADLDPTVAALGDLINADPKVYERATRMLTEAPFKKDPMGHPVAQNVTEMLVLVNAALNLPPPYDQSGCVGFPIDAIFDWAMSTESGNVFFMNDQVNIKLKAILNRWAQYLESSDSLDAFKDPSEGGAGWMTPDAVKQINMTQFVQPDPTALGWGYPNWNAWFIREFIPGARPVSSPDDDKVVVTPCEATPYAIQTNVQLRDTFWVKGQPYGLSFVLGGNPVANEFVGGTVFQGYLNAFNYHRWNSPITGTIVSTEVIPGTYYSALPEAGWDDAAATLSQAYIANFAARAVIMIRSDNPEIGMLGFVALGMSEVSTTTITVAPGTRIKKGEHLGHFQFGGSSFLLIFRRDAIARWEKAAIPSATSEVVPLGRPLAYTN